MNDRFKVAEEHGLIDASKKLERLHHVSVKNVVVDRDESWVPGVEIELSSREIHTLYPISRTLDEYDLKVDDVQEKDSTTELVKLSSTTGSEVSAI